ncbi:MAG: PIG-L family deacetylase [Verrucomicrobiaceae bacterium]|nr:PIG-L family deacetylase [Verrucomicrobiaceae bacterium]
MPSALAIFAHPDDIEFVAAGTLLLLKERGWDIHYMNLCSGNCGSVQMDAETTARKRLAEAQEAARILGAAFYPPVCDDMELAYTPQLLRKVAAVVREAKAEVVLTHAPSDYMEDHMEACRLAVSAAFAHGIPNFATDPPREAFFHDVTVYHAMPHGLCTPLRVPVKADAFVNTTSVHEIKRRSLAAHESQKHWLDVSQGMDSYLVSMDDASRRVGGLSGRFEFAEGWRRHLHLGFSAAEIDPLRDALGDAWMTNSGRESAD